MQVNSSIIGLGTYPAFALFLYLLHKIEINMLLIVCVAL